MAVVDEGRLLLARVALDLIHLRGRGCRLRDGKNHEQEQEQEQELAETGARAGARASGSAGVSAVQLTCGTTLQPASSGSRCAAVKFDTPIALACPAS